MGALIVSNYVFLWLAMHSKWNSPWGSNLYHIIMFVRDVMIWQIIILTKCTRQCGSLFRICWSVSHTYHNVLYGQSYPSQCPDWSIIPITTSCMVNHTHHNVLIGQSYPSQCPDWSIIPITMSCMVNHTHHNVLYGQSYPSQCHVWSIIPITMSCMVNHTYKTFLYGWPYPS